MNIDKRTLAKPNILHWEISFALLIKILLLTGLWFLIFRWQDQPADKPDMARHFALSTPQTSTVSDFPSQP